MMNNKSVFFLSVIVLTGIAIILLNTKITPKFEFIEKPKEEIKYLEGDQLTNLTWSANGDSPSYFLILIDGNIISNSTWDGSEIVIKLYDLDLDSRIGNTPYNITCLINDSENGSLSHSVKVIIISKIEQNINQIFSPEIITLFLLSIFLGLIGVVAKR